MNYFIVNNDNGNIPREFWDTEHRIIITTKDKSKSIISTKLYIKRTFGIRQISEEKAEILLRNWTLFERK